MRDPKERLRDILEAIAAIERYRDRDQSSFERDERLQTWFLRHLQIIGEAARLMPDKTGALAPEIPWASIIGMRNILIHGYFEIDTDIVPELTPQASDDVISKTRFSGFFETDLDACLKKLGVTHPIITGCNTSICVNSTVRDGMFRDYLPVLLADCMSEPIGHGSPRSNHDASLLNAEVLLGWVSDSERFLKAVQP